MTTTTLVRRPLRRTPSSVNMGMNRFFEDFLGSTIERCDEGLTDQPWRPAVDVRESDTAYEVTAELPGLSKKDVKITFDNGVLTFKGERQLEESSDEGNVHRLERSYGSFSRSFVLPTEVETEKVDATFESGVLTIKLPKVERARSRKIDIH